jgi:hypothetical protein
MRVISELNPRATGWWITNPNRTIRSQIDTGQKESAKRYINNTAERMIKFTTNSQETWAPASSQTSHFDNKVEAYLACLCFETCLSVR